MQIRPLQTQRDATIKSYLSPEHGDFSGGKYNAIYRAKVINTNDPQNRGRVLVRVSRFDSINELDENYKWAYVSALFGGPANSGVFIIPAINSTGVVAYLDGDGTTVVWLGSTNIVARDIRNEEGEIEYTIPAIPVEMDNDPTTIVWKTQYPTREENIFNLNIHASGDDPETWVKSENLLKLSENEFTLLKYNQGRTTTDGHTIGYTYNYEPYTIDDDVMVTGEVEDPEDTEDPLNLNYSNFFRIEDDETRWLYRTKVTKPNVDQEDAEHSAVNTIWMDDDGIHIGDIWDNYFSMDNGGIHIVASTSIQDAKFELKDDWGNFIIMQQSGIWMHGANVEDNPQVDDPAGDYEYGEAFENVHFDNQSGLQINTLGDINLHRSNPGGDILEYFKIVEDELKISTAENADYVLVAADQIKISTDGDATTINVEPGLIELTAGQAVGKFDGSLVELTSGQATAKLDGGDVSIECTNAKINANANVEITGNAKVAITGNAKVEIGNMVDLGAAIGQVLNSTAMMIAPPGVTGGPVSVAFPGQIMVKA